MIINDLFVKKDALERADACIISPDGSEKRAADDIICEHTMDIYVNSAHITSSVCTADNLVEMVVGRLITEGIVSRKNFRAEIESIEIGSEGELAYIVLKNGSGAVKAMAPSIDCSCERTFASYDRRLEPLPQMPVSRDMVFDLINAFAVDSKLHKKTKGTHSCYIYMDGGIIFSAEDIGRHNAVDKCVGYAALSGLDTSEMMIFTTGRIPSDMAQKFIAAGFPVVVSKAVPTSGGIALAKRYSLTLICKAWPDSFAVYSGGENIC